jgi:drug/metabolite transporter (DMT)-like permease
MPASAWGQLLFIAVLSTVAGYLVWAKAIQVMTATGAAAYIYFIPIVSALVSILFFGERLGLLALLGGGLILGGVLLIQRARIPARPPGGLPSRSAAR